MDISKIMGREVAGMGFDSLEKQLRAASNASSALENWSNPSLSALAAFEAIERDRNRHRFIDIPEMSAALQASKFSVMDALRAPSLDALGIL